MFRRLASGPAEARRDLATEWLDCLGGTDLPLASRGGGRKGQAFALGAPLPAGMAAERELADLFLAERLPAWRVRGAVASALPGGVDLVELGDVWVGAPALARAVVGADYRLMLGSDAGPGADALRVAADSLLAEPTLPRVRQKGDREVAYDLRPLVAAIDVLAGAPVVLRLRARFDPDRGSGRPQDVIAALSDRLGQPVMVASIVRERLLLAEDLADGEGRERGVGSGRNGPFV